MSDNLPNYYEVVISSKQNAPDYQICFEDYLFHQERHLKQQGNSDYYTFLLLNHKKKTIEAKSTLFLTNSLAQSPFKASFGAPEFKDKLTLSHLAHFIWFQEEFLRKKQIKEIQIKAYPFAYHSENSQILTQLLFRAGYQIQQTELNQHIAIDALPFYQKIHLSARRRLQKCKKAGFYVEEWLKPDLVFVYEFVKKCRLRKTFPITLSRDAFIHLYLSFPDCFKVFVVKNKKNIIALTVVIVISPSILYSFYPADDEAYLSFSPTILLNEGLYEYSKRNHIKLLDLGISTEKSQPNWGLIRFKQNTGGLSSLKLSFHKIL